MKKTRKSRRFKLRAAFLSLLTIALLAATAAFIGTSAANAVSDSDLATSGSDISSTDITALADEIPADLGEPKIVMTTSKAVGETLGFKLDISSAYVDWGDGNIVACSGTISGDTYSYSEALVGNIIKVYSIEDITYLDCINKQLTALDVSNNTALTTLYCGYNNLTELDVSKNTALTKLDCSTNQLTTLDVSKNTALNYLSCFNNKLTTLDVSKNTALTDLDCGVNILTSLDVSNNTALTYLCCVNNKLTTLDVSKNIALTNLDCSWNSLTALDVSKNTALNYFRCYENRLKFSTIKINKDVLYGRFLYSPQADVKIAASVKANKTIDLSSEYEVYGQNTVYKWYEAAQSSTSELSVSSDSEVTPTKSENGVFTFGDEFVGKTLYCTITNEAFPDLTLKTTNVKITANDTPDTPDNPADPAENGPGTGESIALTIVASCLAMLSLAAIGAVVYKKKLMTLFNR
ncbi:MAG: leucine-rich repeat domain-containing protein [Acutalibacteraceae bacterium]